MKGSHIKPASDSIARQIKDEDWTWYSRNLILNDCLHNHPPESLGAIMHYFGTTLGFDAGRFYFLLTGLRKRIYYSVFNIDAAEYLRMYHEMENGLKRILSENACAGDFFIVFEEDSKQIALIFSPSAQCSPRGLAEKIEAYVQHYYEEHLFRGDDRYCSFTALSEEQSGLSGIREGYLAVRALSDLDFFIMKPAAVTDQDIAGIKNDLDYRKTIELCRKLDFCMISGNDEEASECLKTLFLDQLKYSFSFARSRDALSFLYNRLDLHLTVYDLLDDYDLERLCSIDSYMKIEECYRALLEPVLALCRRVQDRGVYQNVVQHAMYFIRIHYSEAITLPMIAESAGVSPNYLSGIFGQEAGISLRDYVTRVRMERARELLISTELMTYQIANVVGIEDAKYFSKLFRSHTGLSPKNFRIQQRIDRNHPDHPVEEPAGRYSPDCADNTVLI